MSTLFPHTTLFRSELLVDERDPARPGVPGEGGRVGFASQLHGAAIRLQEAGQAGEERALARSVLADERVHLARPDLQAGLVEGHRGAEALRDPGETEGGGVVHSSTPHRIPTMHRNASELALARAALLHSDASPQV